MKKKLIMFSAAILFLTSAILGQVFISSSVVSASSVKSTAAAKPTAQPVMTNNLSKYGLKAEVDLPFTQTVNGLSYTLHKMMIYSIDSAEAKNLMKTYGYANKTDYYPNAKYFIWTKITITNKSKYKTGVYARDLTDKWKFLLEDGRTFDAVMPTKKAWDFNSTEALWSFILEPGQSLTTYQAYELGGELTDVRFIMNYKSNTKEEKFATLVN